MIRNKKFRKLFRFLLLFIFILVITKVDYRIEQPQPWHSHDDASYFFHAYTIGLDFDLDYTNQISNDNNFYNENKSNPVPTHPIGAGLLASPFVFFGNFFGNFFFTEKSSLQNFVYFAYSISSIYYFFLTVVLIKKSLYNFGVKNISYIYIFYLLLGSGLGYYAFERFSMTAVYESFGLAVIIYLCSRYNKKSYFFAGTLSVMFLGIRWVNFYLLIIPFVCNYLFKNSKNTNTQIFKNAYLYIGTLFGFLLYFLHTFVLYGSITLNPASLNSYGNATSLIDNYLLSNNISILVSIETLLSTLNSILLILLSQEFGLLWFSPVLFFMFYIVLKFLFKKEPVSSILITLLMIVPLAIIVLWQSAASSYGYRYIFGLIPFAIILSIKHLSKLELKILNSFNLLSIFLYLFFETNELTSLMPQINVFGSSTAWSARYYIQGVFEAVANISSYMVILGTSFLSVILLKILISISSINTVQDIFAQYNLLNGDVERVISFSSQISYYSLSILLIMFIIFVRIFINYKYSSLKTN